MSHPLPFLIYPAGSLQNNYSVDAGEEWQMFKQQVFGRIQYVVYVG
jgi:hypothetical protein